MSSESISTISTIYSTQNVTWVLKHDILQHSLKIPKINLHNMLYFTILTGNLG